MEDHMFAAFQDESPKQSIADLKTPCYIIDEDRLEKNARILAGVADRTGAKILLAQKAFSNFHFYPLLSHWLAGTEASGLFEARLGHEEMPSKETHVFSAAYREDEFQELLKYADHIVFNSISQLEKFGFQARAAHKQIGLRINPECSTQQGHAIYDPCAPGSRLGVTRDVWNREMTPRLCALLDGLHFHTLCEQGADALELTMAAVAEKFGDVMRNLKWLNMGGGHHITKSGYDIVALERIIQSAHAKWGLHIYLEPGEAVALNAGFLATRVLDVVWSGSIRIAILDASAACHMPDVLEMPYTPPLYQSTPEGAFAYRLAGPTCLAGDIIGDYILAKELKPGDLLIFGDMAIYTTCKNNTFNGMPLPEIWKRSKDGKLSLVKKFGYSDFKNRLS